MPHIKFNYLRPIKMFGLKKKLNQIALLIYCELKVTDVK